MSEREHYVHGTSSEEQARLTRLNALLNARSLEALGLRGGEAILDVGAGLGQFTRAMARRAGGAVRAIGVERDVRQREEAARQTRADGEETLVAFRAGDAVDLPLEAAEWGTFDVVHARFVLEHVPDPAAVVRSMVRAARPGGRIVLEDDDHEVLRLWPEPPGVLDLWRAYYRTYERNGKDPFVGRRLVSLLHEAGAVPRSSRSLGFDACAGGPDFQALAKNFIGILEGARTDLRRTGLASDDEIESGLEAFRAWAGHPAAALWYTTCWAEGIRQA
jgi:SAM-dependent methyltransferase